MLAPDGFIYCIPALSKQVLRIDPIKRETVLFGIIRGKEIKYENGFVGKDGNIFAMPISTKSGMLCIDLKAAERMEAEGYDDLRFLLSLDEGRLRKAAEEIGMKRGHVDKLLCLVPKYRTAWCEHER